MDKEKDTVVDFSEFSKDVPSDLELTDNDDYINLGLDAFNNALEDAQAFLSITFDEDGQPTILWAGNLDSFIALGALRVAENMFINKLYRS